MKFAKNLIQLELNSVFVILEKLIITEAKPRSKNSI
jgi:hypothetical protein